MDSASGRGIELRGRTLRQHAARGTVINGAFMVGLGGLSLIRGLLVAAFISPSDYGLWGILVVTLATLTALKQVGISDRYVQQDEDDQELAFQQAFTLELLASVGVAVLLLATLAVVAGLLGRGDVVAPGLVIAATVPAMALQSPGWIFYRRMQFLRQRILQAVEPVVGFVATIALVVAGAGIWALVLGFSIGVLAGAGAALAAAPIRPALRFDRLALGQYAGFSGPLLVATLATAVLAQTAILGTEAHLGIAAVGALTLASTITQFSARVDELVTGTLYPAVCAVRDRTDLLRETFVKSNRLALMWGVPFGVGVSLFCGDLVTQVLGARWEPAVPLLQISGVVAALGQVAFNWDAYFRARGETRPIAVASCAAALAFVSTGVPLLLAFDLVGLAVAIGIQALVHLACRALFLRRLFSGLSFARHALRAVFPSVPAAALVLLAHAVDAGGSSPELVLAQLALYVTVTVVVTWWCERDLLREAMGYLARRRPADVAL